MSGKRNTIQRQLVHDSLKALNCHAAAEQVYEHVVLKYPSISKATVYRNLHQLAESGELLAIGNIDGSCRYDHNCHDHYHFICENCKRVFDVEDYFPELYEKLSGMDGFSILNHSITFGGLCPDCKK